MLSLGLYCTLLSFSAEQFTSVFFSQTFDMNPFVDGLDMSYVQIYGISYMIQRMILRICYETLHGVY